MSQNQQHAKREMALAGIGDQDSKAILYILRLFFATWDSGGAVSVMIPVLEKLLRQQPLTPLTGADEEWHKPMDDVELWQNVRCSTVFKDAIKAWDINAPDVQEITFPYEPSIRRDETPIITLGRYDGLILRDDG